MALIGCSDDGASGADGASNPGAGSALSSDTPADQRWALDDGQVTLGEYQEGFENFRECAANDGVVVTMTSIDARSGLIDYAVSGESQISTAESCYERVFAEIDATFQVTNPEVIQAQNDQRNEIWENEMRPCLVANGVDVPEVADANTKEVADLLPVWSDLSRSGRC